jgi:hypothetical protein
MQELRCNWIEVMWSEVAHVAGDEEGTGVDGTVSGGQV